MKDLQQVRTALIAGLGGDESKLHMLNARVILRTGVSLAKIDPRHAHDAKRIQSVLLVLREMGFEIDANSPRDKG